MKTILQILVCVTAVYAQPLPHQPQIQPFPPVQPFPPFPPPPVDLSSPCAAILCLQGTVCRAVFPCTTCSPRAQCINSSLIPEGIDAECQRQDYQQALLLEERGRPNSFNQLKCRLRDGYCPPGSSCKDDFREEGTGTCCILPNNPPPPPPPALDIRTACARVRCRSGTTCRIVHPCQTCPPEAQCVENNLLGEGIDIECERQKYTTALLVEQKNAAGDPISYNLLKCRGPLAPSNFVCPRYSVCANDLRGGGTCCTGKPDPTVKPGSCPNRPISVCGGVFCSNDQNCPGRQKCCLGCGSGLCTEPIFDPNNRCGGCPFGHSCVDRPFPCPPGRFCILALVPTCVPNGCLNCAPGQDCLKRDQPANCGQKGYPPCPDPEYFCEPVCGPNKPCPPGEKCVPDLPIHPGQSPQTKCVPDVDQCGGCDKDEVCIDTGIRCIRAPCPTYQCVKNNKCGGCRPGQVCINTNIVCVKAPCPTYQCVDDNQCGGCPPGKKCELLHPPCPPCPGGVCPPNYCPPVPVCIDIGPDEPVCDHPCPPGTECRFETGLCPPGRLCERRASCLPLEPEGPPPPRPAPVATRTKPGTCPRARRFYELNSGICRYEIRRLRPNTCEDDNDCPGPQKCCISKCNRSVCLYPYLPRAQYGPRGLEDK